MADERFRVSPFPPLTLTEATRVQLLQLAQRLIRASFDRNEAFVRPSAAQRRAVDTHEWKLLKQRERLQVFGKRPPDGRAFPMGNAVDQLPTFLAVGGIDGALDDLMLGLVAPTPEDMRVKAAYVHDFSGAAVLSSLVAPSADDPFLSCVVKWMELDFPLSATGVVQNRDYVFLEATGFMELPGGDRVGYHLVHSVDFAELPSLPGRVRGEVAVSGLFRQGDVPGDLRVVKSGLLDPRGDWIRIMAVPAMAAALLSPLEYVHCGQMRKLAWRVERHYADKDATRDRNENARVSRRRRGSLSQTASHSSSAASASSASASSVDSDDDDVCESCERPRRHGLLGLGGKRHKTRDQCKLCHSALCSSCRVKLSLSFLAIDGELEQRHLAFCPACVADTAAASARDVAVGRIHLERSERQHTKRVATRVARERPLPTR